MKNPKHFLLFILMVLALSVSACGVNEQEVIETEIEIEESDEDTGIVESEANAEVGKGDTGEAELTAITEEDAYALVVEKLPDESFEAFSYGALSVDDRFYEIFSIKKDGKELSQKMAVDDKSGEVFVYDELNAKFLPLTEFEYYDSAKDPNVDWNGTYLGDKYLITIEMTDPGNLEYSVKKGLSKSEAHPAFLTDYTTAVNGEDNVTLTLDGEKLKVSVTDGKCEYVGEYKKQ